MKRVKHMQAGRYVLACSYSQIVKNDTPATRSGKRNMQEQAQAAMNLKYSYQKCLLQVACNFPDGLFITLSYDDDHLPQNRPDVKKELRCFIAAMRREYARRSVGKFDYLYTAEGRHGEARLHHHVICHEIENAHELFESMWGVALSM